MLHILVVATFFARLVAGQGDLPKVVVAAGETEKQTAPAVEQAAATVEQEFEVDGALNTATNASAPATRGLGAGPLGNMGNSLIEEWDKTMEGFTPELLLTFPVPHGTDEYFYEDVGIDPIVIRGGFFASAQEETSSIDFQIHDPSGEIVFEKKDTPEGLFHFVANKKGTYAFIISNHKWIGEKMVTFTVGKGNETALQTDHLDTVDDHVKLIERSLKDIQTESTYLWIRQKSHIKTVESIHRRVFCFCVVEFLILTGITGFQVYYIKGLLSDRRVL